MHVSGVPGAGRLAMYLREGFPDHDVDVEYNRVGYDAKRLRGLPEECRSRRNRGTEAPVAVPYAIVHTRGSAGPNLPVIEVKKTSNPVGMECDRQRIAAFREQLGYTFGALIECETAFPNQPEARIALRVIHRR